MVQPLDVGSQYALYFPIMLPRMSKLGSRGPRQCDPRLLRIMETPGDTGSNRLIGGKSLVAVGT
jgi:hypothetical protein